MNPIKQIRIDHNLTQEALASLAGISVQVVKKVEAGIYPSMPPTLLRALVVLCGSGTSMAILDSYEVWILKELREVKIPECVSFGSPAQFKEFRSMVCALNGEHNTIIGFCKIMKIHPFVIEKYEKGRMKQTPELLIERIKYVQGTRVGSSGSGTIAAD